MHARSPRPGLGLEELDHELLTVSAGEYARPQRATTSLRLCTSISNKSARFGVVVLASRQLPHLAVHEFVPWISLRRECGEVF
jgi:hypothetical protein